MKSIRAQSCLSAIAIAIVATISLGSCSAAKAYPSAITPIYAATKGAGLFVWDGSTWRNYTVTSTGGTSVGLASDTISSIALLGSGSEAAIFLGTDKGVASYDGRAWATWTAAGSGLGSDVVNGLFIGTGLVAATADGLSMYDRYTDTWTNDPVDQASPPIVLSIDKNERFTFVGTSAGLYVYNGTALLRHYRVADGLASDSVQSLQGLSSEEIYAGTTQGLSILNAATGAFQTPAQTSGHAINCLYLDSSGMLWIAADNGLFAYAPGYGMAGQALSGQNVLSICVDGAGNIYAGTSSGLTVSYDGGNSWSQKLSGNGIYAVATTAPLYSF
jgi:ligand-binding sensor domain-containing protein